MAGIECQLGRWDGVDGGTEPVWSVAGHLPMRVSCTALPGTGVLPRRRRLLLTTSLKVAVSRSELAAVVERVFVMTVRGLTVVSMGYRCMCR